MLAYVAYGANDSEEAIEYFQKSIEQERFRVGEEAKMRFYIAQLYASMQRWSESIAAMQRWLLYVETPDPLGQARIIRVGP